jgi:hypothetical protein
MQLFLIGWQVFLGQPGIEAALECVLGALQHACSNQGYFFAAGRPTPPMSMVGREGTLVVAWNAFANPWQPTSVDSEPYHAWYAIARKDYIDARACLLYFTVMAQGEGEAELPMTRARAVDASIGDPLHLGLVAGMTQWRDHADSMTRVVEDMRAAALNIMRTRDTAATQAIILEKFEAHSRGRHG